MTFKGIDGDLPIYDIDGMRLPVACRLPADRFDGLALTPPVSVTIRRLKGKPADARPVTGQLSHASTRWVRFLADIALPPDTAEIRIDLAAEGSLNAAPIYARLRSDQSQSAPPTASTARVSFISPAARERLGIRTGDPGENGA